jgi:tetratricopeptide (TPR) repeat protein
MSASEKLAHSRTLYLSVIEELIKSDKAHAALAHLDEFDREYGASAPSEKLRADAWFAIGDMGKAEAGYRSILGGPLASFGKHGLGRIAAMRADWASASEQFGAAVLEQPTNPKFLNDYGCSLFRLGRMAEAETALRKAHELAPHDREISENVLVYLAKTNGVDRLDDIFGDVRDEAERADLRARLLAYAEPERRAKR